MKKVLSTVLAAVAIMVYTGCSQNGSENLVQPQVETIETAQTEQEIEVIINSSKASRSHIDVKEYAVTEAHITLYSPSSDTLMFIWVPGETSDTISFPASEEGVYTLTVDELDENGKYFHNYTSFDVKSGINYEVDVTLGKNISVGFQDDDSLPVVNYENLVFGGYWYTAADEYGSTVEMSAPPSDTMIQSTMTLAPQKSDDEFPWAMTAVGLYDSLSGATALAIEYTSSEAVTITLEDGKNDVPYMLMLPATADTAIYVVLPVGDFALPEWFPENYDLDLNKVRSIGFYADSEAAGKTTYLSISDLRVIRN